MEIKINAGSVTPFPSGFILEPVYSSAIPLWGRAVILAHHAVAPEYHAVASELRGQIATGRDVGIVHFSREWKD